MHQVQVNVVHTEILQGRGKAILDAVVPGVVELGGEPDLLTRDTGVADTGANLGLVAVGQGSVDVTVARLQGILDSHAHLVGLGLPGTQTNGGDLVTGVKGVGLPGMGISNCQTAWQGLSLLSVLVRHFERWRNEI